MDCSTPGFPVHHKLLELAQTHDHRVSDAIQPSHPLSSPSPPKIWCSQKNKYIYKKREKNMEIFHPLCRLTHLGSVASLQPHPPQGDSSTAQLSLGSLRPCHPRMLTAVCCHKSQGTSPSLLFLSVLPTSLDGVLSPITLLDFIFQLNPLSGPSVPC